MDFIIKYILSDLPAHSNIYSLDLIQLEEWVQIPNWGKRWEFLGDQLELMIARAYELHAYLIWTYDVEDNLLFKYVSIFKERLN